MSDTELHLPAEIWIKILAQLDYYAVKKCWLNNRAYRDLIDANEVLRAIIFRSMRAFEIKPSDLSRRLDVHPVLHRLSPMLYGQEAPEQQEIGWFGPAEPDSLGVISPVWSTMRLLRTTMANENATNPPVSGTKDALSLRGALIFPIALQFPIRVQDVSPVLLRNDTLNPVNKILIITGSRTDMSNRRVDGYGIVFTSKQGPNQASLVATCFTQYLLSEF